MKENPTISVIAPVYNVESYLDKCISSVVSQSYTDIELILIDDGSTDTSGKLCDAWAARDARIRVIHQKNKGAGAARNVGIDIARGKYIAFIDSDDYISSDMYGYLLKIIGENDIAETAYVKVGCDDDNAQFTVGDKVTMFSACDAMREHINDRVFCQIIYNKLYRREVIGDIRFPVGKLIDDEFFTYRVIGRAKSLVASDRVCYAYRQQQGSVMHSMPWEKRIQAVEAKAERLDYIKNKFPDLALLGARELHFTCIYQGQLALRNLAPDKSDRIINYIKQVMRSYPANVFGNGIKTTIWLTAARINIRFTCKTRNALGIGL